MTARFPVTWRVNADANRTARIEPPKARPWYRIANATSERARLWVYDEIGGWGISASDFTRSLETVTAPAIDVYINSPGGEVGDGIAIHEALRRHPAQVTTTVDSLAASIASVIYQAGDVRMIAEPGVLMIHRAWGVAVGNRNEMAAMGKVLDKFDGVISGIYAARSGEGSSRSWLRKMDAETWYDAQEAVDAGLADRVVEHRTANVAASSAASANLLAAFVASMRPSRRVDLGEFSRAVETADARTWLRENGYGS